MGTQFLTGLDDLKLRRSICLAFIDLLDKSDPNDPRRKDALEEYKRQLAVVDGKIEALTGKPPDVVVGLKSAQLFGKAG